jgi:hypothetical protein
VIYTDPNSDSTSDDYLVMADKHMYEVKRARKSEMGEKPEVDRPFEKRRFFK